MEQQEKIEKYILSDDPDLRKLGITLMLGSGIKFYNVSTPGIWACLDPEDSLSQMAINEFLIRQGKILIFSTLEEANEEVIKIRATSAYVGTRVIEINKGKK